ncbi:MULTISPECIES: lipoprotein [Tatumella]|uniref:Lipoprotein n=1 Tax=Tatumella punctata TaxID=399969 RepID=A0ABW1VPV2_9GAMM|nr:MULTISPECIES: lipoprotein [unclassified Tatumella]MBS0856897.1 lipoprotein [Tatumella sp. JGM16]MBS0877675.1 lipoprotein [Tatumella sp. JGM82]MBS0891380.1 lipoprotein [Tatumella sp. JGM94]MBS0894536.1 lipoprotein [Tatumella sp. JGM130]MBS0902207.1 lipoprotein [Tatumella sp. JGM100]
MRKLFICLSLLFTALLLTGCDHLTQYTISEQQVNNALKKHDNYQKDIGVNGLASAHIVLTDLQSAIGREEPNKMTLSGTADIQLQSLFGQQDARVSLKMKAQPVFDPQQSAIYLQDLQITDSQVSPDKLRSVVTALMPVLNQSLQEYFKNHPAYVLSADRSTAEGLAKKLAKGLEVKPGELVISLTR